MRHAVVFIVGAEGAFDGKLMIAAYRTLFQLPAIAFVSKKIARTVGREPPLMIVSLILIKLHVLYEYRGTRIGKVLQDLNFYNQSYGRLTADVPAGMYFVEVAYTDYLNDVQRVVKKVMVF